MSDQGATAVLLKMDEFQGRLDTPGAPVRRGAHSESDVLPALAMPVLKVAPVPAAVVDDASLPDFADLRDALERSMPVDEQCDDLFADDDRPPGVVERLGEGKLLVSVRCWMAAYNEGYGYWVVNAEPPYEPALVTIRVSRLRRWRNPCRAEVARAW